MVLSIVQSDMNPLISVWSGALLMEKLAPDNRTDEPVCKKIL